MKDNGSLHLQLGKTLVEVATECSALRGVLAHIYRPFVADGHIHSLPALQHIPSDSEWRASVDGQEFVFDEFQTAVRALEDVVANRLLQEVSHCLLIHAAAVRHDHVCILVIGPSGRGKTTIALELVRRGMQYLTDEFTAIEPCGAVLRPFPRSAAQKFQSDTPLGVTLAIPGEPGYRAHMLPDHRSTLTPHSISSFKIIFPTHQAHRVPEARPLGSAEICARLMPSIFNFEGREQAIWPILANVVTRASACEFIYREVKSDLDLAMHVLR